MSIKRFRNLLLFILASGLFVACTDLSQPVKNQVAVNSERVNERVQFVETAKPGKFLQDFASQRTNLKNTLIIMDLDDTTITSPEGQWLGRSEMFYDLLGQELKKSPGRSKKDIAEKLDPLLIEVYWRVPVVLTDDAIPGSIEMLKKKGATVIGMTARGRTLWDVTLNQLQRAGVDFSDITVVEGIALGDSHHVVMRKGVVFTTQKYTKGDVISALMASEILPEGLNHVVMIDDREENLVSFADASLKSSALWTQFTPVLCTYPKTVRTYNSEEAAEQLEKFLANWQKDPVIANLIKNDSFTRAFLKQCASSKESKQKQQCQLLLQNG